MGICVPKFFFRQAPSRLVSTGGGENTIALKYSEKSCGAASFRPEGEIFTPVGARFLTLLEIGMTSPHKMSLYSFFSGCAELLLTYQIQ